MKPVAIWNCTSKKRYDSEEDAIDTAEFLWQEKEIELEPYRCNICEGWHLTRSRS